MLDEQIKQIKEFRDERLERIKIARETLPITGVGLAEGGATILHIVPVRSLELGAQHDWLQEAKGQLEPMRHEYTGKSYNFDGFAKWYNKPTPTYIQIFRGGAIEAVNVEYIGNPGHGPIMAVSLRHDVTRAVSEYLHVAKDRHIEPPVGVMLTLSEVSQRTLDGYNNRQMYPIEPYPADRYFLLLPDLMITDYDIDVELALAPVFDTLWQTGGFERAPTL